jgi:hypothetical protein
MSKAEVIKKFNSIVTDLLDQVSPLLGKKYCIYFSQLIKVNSILPIKNFVAYGIQHKEIIMNRNPDYFLNDDTYKTDVKEYYGDRADDKLMEILDFKKIYTTIDDGSKENLWDIVIALLLLAEEYNSI